MSSVLGLDAKLYRNTGSYGSPTWNEIVNVKDLTMTLEKGEADVTTRNNNGWRARRGTLKDMTIEFQMVWDTDDADFVAIRQAFTGNTSIEVLCLDGAVGTPGNEGVRATMEVFSFTRTENLEEALMVSVTLRPTYADNGPAWYESV